MDTIPLDELIGFLKHGDNYTQDTREWPDPTEPRASKPPMGKGCTCPQGKKLDCPVHGMHADPELVELDHTWSMPQAQPVGYQQDGPRNWTQAVSSFTYRQAESPTSDAGDTSIQANSRGSARTESGSSSRFLAAPSPGLFRALGHRQRKLYPLFGIGALDVPKFDSFTVSNRQNESVNRLGDFVDMENGFVPFGIPKHGARPFVEGSEDDSEGVRRSVENRSSFGVHGSTIEQVVAEQSVPIGQVREDGVDAKVDTNEPYKESNNGQTGDQSECESQPSQDIGTREQSESHKWSVTRIGLKLRPYKPGKCGKGMIQSEEAPEAQIWRVKGGWNGSPHHDQMKEALGIVRPLIAFHIDKQGCFYFHEEDDGFVKPKDSAKLAQQVEEQYPELKWGAISAEEYEARDGKEGSTEHTAAMSQLTQVIAAMQTPKEPRRLVISRDHEGRMASIEEVPIT